MERIYSNRIWISLLEYLDKKFGREVADRVLAAVGGDRLALTDANGFQTLEFGTRLVEAAEAITGEKDIAYKSGREFAESLGKIGGAVVGLTSPQMCMKLMGKIEPRIALKTITQTEALGRNQYRLRVSFRDGFREPELACRNRIGIYESLPRVFGLPYGKVDHPKCAFRGHSQCEYLVTIPEHGFIAWKKVVVAAILVAAAFGLWSLLSGRMALHIGTLVSLFASLASLVIYKDRQAAHALEWTLLSNEGLAAQNRELEKDNARIQGLQSLTLALGKHVHTQDICENIVSILVKGFGYGSSQIWLLDEGRTMLSNRAAQGYDPNLQAFIRNTRFEMGRDWDNPYGMLVQTLEHGQTLLVNDVEAAMQRLTSRTREFIAALNPSSFIITPLFHGRTAIGILTAEHHGGAKLVNKDRMLFLSISSITANALVKADLFEKMEDKIQQRTRELEAANSQLLAAKEMAIQSEKLSSLGQMAAGVAHEINNPLNFLVNIIPDLRRDVEALEKIRSLAMEKGAGDGLADEVRAIDAEYELADHLKEKEFVFGRIQKALEKSTRIANSLKVFSRSSAKEILERVSFAAMLQQVVDLIPRKTRGDTRIEMDIPTDLSWVVNKNEMEQAFLALINNAIDAMGQKGVVRIQALEDAGEILLSFRDEGPGIPPEVVGRIFDPFFTTKPPGKGTGLGLTIASEIVRKYGGALSATSEQGKGATFLIRFRKAFGEISETLRPGSMAGDPGLEPVPRG